jgi:Sigma-70 region 2
MSPSTLASVQVNSLHMLCKGSAACALRYCRCVTEVTIQFLVESLIEKQIKLGKWGLDLETAVLQEIRSRERVGQIALWPSFDYYLHERAVEQTGQPDGRPGNQNAYDRYLISDYGSSIRKRLNLDTPSSVSPSFTAGETESKGKKTFVQDDSDVALTYRHWPDTNTRTAEGVIVDWGSLFKIACKIANDLCRDEDSPVHYHNNFAELLQEAWYAIHVKAIPRYNSSRDAQFTTFAYRVIRNHLLDFIRWPVDPVEDGDKVRTRTGRDIGTSDLDFDAIPWGQPRLMKSPHRHSEESSASD